MLPIAVLRLVSPVDGLIAVDGQLPAILIWLVEGLLDIEGLIFARTAAYNAFSAAAAFDL